MTNKLTVASELLDSALRLYFDGNAYFASLHLAGAAEEILGAYVTHHGGISAFTSIQDGAVRISNYIYEDKELSKLASIRQVMNHAKNSVKHMNSLDDSSVSFDAKSQAEASIDRAISNYSLLMAHSTFGLKCTELISRFNARLSK